MAIGDRTPTKLIRKSLTTTATDSSYANVATNRTEITKIVLTGQDGNSTARTVTIYIGGTTAANEYMNFDIDPAGANNVPKTIIAAINEVLTSTETIYAKVDAGTDINITVSGIVEQIS